MQFQKKKLFLTPFSLLDIGTYKIRSISWKIGQKSVFQEGYSEKRQENSSFLFGEPKDFDTICENINIALKKSEKGKEAKEVLLNLISSQSFFHSRRINFTRNSPETPISEEEIIDILKKFQKKYLHESYEEIYKKSALKKQDLVLIFSSIWEIRVNGEKMDIPIGKTGKNIKIGLINIFMPLHFFEMTKKIFFSLGRKNFKIIPFEYALLRTIKETDIVVVNIGNTKTTIGVKKDGFIIGSTRVNIGIGDLIKQIKENENETQIKVLKNIDKEDFYKKEKENFLIILEECLVSGLDEILLWEICPHNFLLLWGGGKNKFIQDFLEKLDFWKSGIKIIKKIKQEKIKEKNDEQGNLIDIDLRAMIKTYQHLEKTKNDFLSKNLKKILKEIEKEG